MATHRFWMCLDQDLRARVFFLRVVEHLFETGRVCTPVGHAGVAFCLVNDQNVAGLRTGQFGVEGRVLAQMVFLNAGDGAPCAIKQRGVIQRMRGQQGFQVRRAFCVEMNACAINGQANGWFAVPARKEGPEKGIFHPHNPGTRGAGDRFAPFGVRGMAPNRDQIVGAGFAQLKGISRKLHDPPHPALTHEASVEIKSPPRRIGLGGLLHIVIGHQLPDRVSPAVEIEPTAPSVPVSAEITLLH